MKRYEIKYLLKEDVSALIGTSICVKGWVRTKRGNKNVAFVAINDGSIIHNIQVVADPTKFEEELKRITTGACIGVEGKLVESQGSGQAVVCKPKKLWFTVRQTQTPTRCRRKGTRWSSCAR